MSLSDVFSENLTCYSYQVAVKVKEICRFRMRLLWFGENAPLHQSLVPRHN